MYKFYFILFHDFIVLVYGCIIIYINNPLLMDIYSQYHLVIYSGVITPFCIAFCVFPGIPLNRRTSGSRAMCILNPDKYSQMAL